MRLRLKPTFVQTRIYSVFAFAVCLMLCFNSIRCIAQGNEIFTRKIFSVEDMQSDFLFFRTLLEKGHPSLYRYRSKDSVDHYFNTALAGIDHPMKEIDFWALLQSLVIKLGSGHTSVRLSAGSIARFNSQSHPFLPFCFFIRNDHLFIRKYFSLGPFEIGDEVLSIDGNSSKRIISTLRNLIPGDGYNNGIKDNQLEGTTFMYLYNIVFGERTEYTVVFQSAQGIRTNIIKGLRLSSRTITQAPKARETTNIPLIKSDTLDHLLLQPVNIPSTLIAKINNFKYDDYRAFHRRLFKYLQQNNISNLVIDLRDNVGGNSNVCKDLMSYLSDKKMKFIASCESVMDINYHSVTTPNYFTNNPSSERRVYQIKTPDTKIVPPNKDHFKGRLYLLINGGTFSAASLLAAALKCQVDCTIVGQETGGGKYGTDGEMIPTFTLPQTNLSLAMPLLWGYSMATGSNEGCGLKPDIEFIANRDQLLEYEAKGIDPFFKQLEDIIPK